MDKHWKCRGMHWNRKKLRRAILLHDNNEWVRESRSTQRGTSLQLQALAACMRLRCVLWRHLGCKQRRCLQITRLGEYESEGEAARQYDQAVRRIVGPSGECNFDLQVSFTLLFMCNPQQVLLEGAGSVTTAGQSTCLQAELWQLVHACSRCA